MGSFGKTQEVFLEKAPLLPPFFIFLADPCDVHLLLILKAATMKGSYPHSQNIHSNEMHS